MLQNVACRRGQVVTLEWTVLPFAALLMVFSNVDQRPVRIGQLDSAVRALLQQCERRRVAK
jgi:hypothetical protein